MAKKLKNKYTNEKIAMVVNEETYKVKVVAMGHGKLLWKMLYVSLKT